VQYLNDAVRREYAANGKRDVLSILFDIVETQCTGNAIDEVIGVLETLLTELIAAGEYDDVAYLLREARTSAVRATTLPVYAKDALNALSDRLSEPGVMSQLLQVLGEASRVPARATLDLLFAELRPGALAPLVSWLATAHASSALSAVEEAATSLASKHTAELVALLESEDEAKVRGALRLTARLKSPAAVPGLGKVMHSDNVELRVAAVAALGDIGSASALQILERVIDDAEREVRVAVLRAISVNRHAGALPRLAQALRRKELRLADLTEKVALFEAYGRVCGEEGVATLNDMLHGRSLLSFREPPDVRACCARALGLVATPEAMRSLQRASDTKDRLVRTEVLRALRRPQ
jgi:HEAT repeat protein